MLLGAGARRLRVQIRSESNRIERVLIPPRLLSAASRCAGQHRGRVPDRRRGRHQLPQGLFRFIDIRRCIGRCVIVTVGFGRSVIVTVGFEAKAPLLTVDWVWDACFAYQSEASLFRGACAA